MRTKKNFYVIAYDVTDDKRRNKVVKLLQKYGKRSNYSVFECMVTDAQLSNIRKSLLAIIDTKDCDSIAFYPICLNCFAKISYLPPKAISNPPKIIVIS
jgi:CRISPR-associated protein Cas2